jgi:esterase/lipase superfamily enzyme
MRQVFPGKKGFTPELTPIFATVTDATGYFGFDVTELDDSVPHSLSIRFPGSDSTEQALTSIHPDRPVEVHLSNETLQSTPKTTVYGGSPGKFGGNPPNFRFGVVNVLFATDRRVTSEPSVKIRNEKEDSERLTYGNCDVAVERIRGDSLFEFIFDRDAKRYYAVQQLGLLPHETFWKTFQLEMTGDNARDALLFIHGYNTSFDEACRRAAQVAYDIKFRGPILLFSWPSRDRFLDYKPDEEMAEWSNPHFAQFLKAALDQPGLAHLHIIAHSMGNRLLVSALRTGALTSMERSHLGALVFAAPDVNRSIFEQVRPLSWNAQNVTLYASSNDQILRISEFFNGFPRAGEIQPKIVLLPGLDSIDASEVDLTLLGHSYIGNSRAVLSDLAALIDDNKPPAERVGLHSNNQPPEPSWTILP